MNIIEEINRTIGCLMAHPDNEPNSEFEDRIDSLIELREEVKSTSHLHNVMPRTFSKDARKKIALMIEHKLGYTNGWRVDDETYENECLMVADELIKLFALPIVVGSSCPECGSANTQQKTKSNDECKDCKSEWAI